MPLFLLLCSISSPCDTVETTLRPQVPEQSAAEVAGLRFEITSRLRKDKDVYIFYKLQWVETEKDEFPFQFRGLFTALNVTYFDENRRKMREYEVVKVHLPDDFRDRERSETMGFHEIHPPKDARFFSIGIGIGGPIVRKLSLPE
jgi:hypothetical protein